MTAEREIAGFALPFAAGILSAGFFSYYEAVFSGGFSCLALILVMSFIMHDRFHLHSTALQISVIASAAFLCGGIIHTAASCMSISSVPDTGFITACARHFCGQLKENIDSLPFDKPLTGAVMKAFITGDRTDIDREVIHTFRESGASHILALSGMHLGLIYLIINRMISFIGNSTAAIRIRSTVLILTCGFYCLATGAGASITRSFLFILLHELSRLTYRKPSLKVIMFSSMVIQLSVNPLSISSASFQLSYAAISGLVFIHPHLKGFWPGLKRPKGMLQKIWESASLSISCQLTTFPLTWHLFGTFPANFLITNLIAIPLTGIIIPLSLLTMALHSGGICPSAVIEITEKCIYLLTESLRIISTM